MFLGFSWVWYSNLLREFIASGIVRFVTACKYFLNLLRIETQKRIRRIAETLKLLIMVFGVSHICSDVRFIMFVVTITMLLILHPIKLVVERSKHRSRFLTVSLRYKSVMDILLLNDFRGNHLLLKTFDECLETWFYNICIINGVVVEVVDTLLYKVVNYLLEWMNLLLFVLQTRVRKLVCTFIV